MSDDAIVRVDAEALRAWCEDNNIRLVNKPKVTNP
jgi:hypothetical protein